MMFKRRAHLATWSVFEVGPLQVTSAVRSVEPERTGDILYEFRVYHDGRLVTRFDLDYHPEGDAGKRFFLEENCRRIHRTIEGFQSDPGYEGIKDRVVDRIRHHMLN